MTLLAETSDYQTGFTPQGLFKVTMDALVDKDLDTPASKAVLAARMNAMWGMLPIFSSQDFEAFKAAAGYEEVRALFDELEHRYITYLEQAHAQALLSRRTMTRDALFDTLEGPYQSDVRGLVKEEANMLGGFANIGRMALIGSGSLPGTVLHMLQLGYEGEAVCVDRDPVALDLASRLVHGFELSQVRVVDSEGSGFDSGGCDLVVVTNYCKDKAGIVAQVVDTAQRGTRVIVRTPMRFGKMFYEYLAREDVQGLDFQYSAETDSLLIRSSLWHKA